RYVMFCERRRAELAAEVLRPRPLLGGRELVALGYPPGPQIGEILRALEEAQLDERIASREEAQQLVAERFPRAPALPWGQLPKIVDEEPDPVTRSPARRVRCFFLREGRAGDVEMCPRHAVDEFGQEQRGGDHAAERTALVLQIGHRAPDVVAI